MAYKKNNSIQEIVFTKYAIREEKNILKLSISKKMQEKYKVKSLNFLIPRKLRKLVDFSKIKMIKIKQEKEKIEMNIISSEIYRKYRETNWHSEYLHSHMLQEAILGVIASYKSYVSLSRIYKEDNSKLKGKPNFPRFKNNNSIQEIIFTKYAIRVEKKDK